MNNGQIISNNINLSLSTEIDINYIDNNSNTVMDFLLSMNHNGHSFLKLYSLSNYNRFFLYKITSILSSAPYCAVGVTFINSNSSFTNFDSFDSVVLTYTDGGDGSSGKSGSSGISGSSGTSGTSGHNGSSGTSFLILAKGTTSIGNPGGSGTNYIVSLGTTLANSNYMVFGSIVSNGDPNQDASTQWVIHNRTLTQFEVFFGEWGAPTQNIDWDWMVVSK